MTGGRDDFFKQVGCFKYESGRIHAGMTADVSVSQQVAVDYRQYIALSFVYQPHRRYSSRMQAEHFRHMAFISKRQPGAAKLCREESCLEYLVSREHEKVEPGLLAVAQEQVLAHRSPNGFLHFRTFIHREGSIVSDSPVWDT